MKKINKSFRYRIYPNNTQRNYIEKCFAGCRVVYNCLLYEIKKEREESPDIKQNLSKFGLSYKVKELKQQEDKRWLYECDSNALIFAAHNLAQGFQKFFRDLKSGNNPGYPRFKHKRDNRHSFKTYKRISISQKGIKIPKLDKRIKVVQHRPIEGELKQITISRKNGKYYASCMTEMQKDIVDVPVKKTIGLDFGVQDFATSTDGKVVKNPAFLLEESKYLAILQRKRSNAVKGSNNYIKLSEKIAKLHEKIVNKRKHFHYNLIRDLLEDNDKIYIQNLDVKKMTQKKDPKFNGYNKNKLNRKILDASPYTFHQRLLYKAEWIGKQVEKIEKYDPTTATCGNCGSVNITDNIKPKKWVCEFCKNENNRDLNGAKNILKSGNKKNAAV